MNQCKECKYWNKNTSDKEEKTAECRRFPPIFDEHGLSGFPTTHYFHWCGEFKAKE